MNPDFNQIAQLLVSGGGIVALWLWNRQLVDTHKVDKEALNANIERQQVMIDKLHESHAQLIKECSVCIATVTDYVKKLEPCKYKAQ
jgi:hypothetical protein